MKIALIGFGKMGREIDLVARVFRQFGRAANRQPDEFSRRPVGLGIQLVKSALAVPARLNQARILKQPQVGRNSRLPHARHFLQLIDR